MPLDGYRIEPIMSFGDLLEYKTLQEIWFSVVDGGDYSLDVYWRGGDTVKELLGESWTSVGSLSLNNPSLPYIVLSKSARLHQIKWGTNANSEKFSISGIKLKGVFGEE